MPFLRILAIASVVVLAGFAWAQPSKARVGMVWNSLPQADLDQNSTAHPGPRLVEEGLRKLGWVRGQNLELLSRSAETHYERFPEIVDAFVRLPVDVLVVFGPEAARAARERTKTIPVVFAGSANVRPGQGNHQNLTGKTYANPVAKRLELLKTIAPTAS